MTPRRGARERAIPLLAHPLGRMALGLVVALVVLGLAEMAMRLFLGPPPAPVKVYSAVDVDGRYLEVHDGLVQVRYQSVQPLAPFPVLPRGSRRIAVLGGSSVHAGVPEVTSRDEFPALLEHLLGVRTLNLGSPGLDSFDLVEISGQLVDLGFSTIVIYAGHNDYGNTYFHHRYQGLSGKAALWLLPSLENFQLFCQLRRALASRDGRPFSWAEPRRQDYQPMSPATRQAVLRNLEANLRLVAWTCRKAGVRLLLVTPVSDLLRPPTLRTCVEQPCPIALWRQAMNMDDPQDAVALLKRVRDLDQPPVRAPTEAIQAIARVASREGVELVDAWQELPWDSYYSVPADRLFADHLHFSAQGHVAMAKMLAGYLGAGEQGSFF